METFPVTDRDSYYAEIPFMPTVNFQGQPLADKFPKLSELCDGRLDELVAYAMQQIADNILDEGTNPCDPRVLNIKVTFKPDMLRSQVEVKGEVAAPKLAPQMPVTSTIVLESSGGMVEQGTHL